MKAFLTGIAFAVGMVLATQAFASDDLGTRCSHFGWKNGHYVCGDISDNS
jgi:hypothetical protein